MIQFLNECKNVLDCYCCKSQVTAFPTTTYIKYDSDIDTSFKGLSVEEYLKEGKTHFINIIENLKSTRSSWKIKLVLGVVFEYNNNYKKVET